MPNNELFVYKTRKLASIQKIIEIKPILNADRIEVLSILGWKVVSQKGIHKVGDLVVYCEIDSVLPEKPEFEFLRDKHFRIKTIRLRGQISQGICFPLRIIENLENIQIVDDIKDIEGKEGIDVTELLGITKYEPPIPANMSLLTKGNFPSYVPKTDEVRIQSEPGLLDELKRKEVYITTKVDGTSATYSIFEGDINVCSRNLSLKESGNGYWEMYKKYNIENILKENNNIAIQGEIVGEGIQGNPLKLKGKELFIFDVYDITKGEYYDCDKLEDFCYLYRLKIVPIIHKNLVFNLTIADLLELAKGKYTETDNDREGIVIRSTENVYSNILGKRLSVKVINNDYLLKEK